jgi:hypothetical protein
MLKTPLALLLATALIALPAAAQKRCERTANACPGGSSQVEESRQLGLVLPVAAAQQAYYSQLIPPGFKAPDLPSHYQVAIYLEEDRSLSGLGRSYRGLVAIRVRRDDAPEAGRGYEPLGRDEEGFLPLVMPVSSKAQYNALRADGLPAILVSGSASDGSTAQSIAVQWQGSTLLSLQWSSDQSGAAEASDDTKRLLMGRLPLFSVLPMLSGGSSRLRTKLTTLPVLSDQAVPQGEYGILGFNADPVLGKLDPALASLLGGSAGSIAALLPASGSGAGQFRQVSQSLLQQTGTLP